MFGEKVKLGAIGGAIFGLLAFIGMLIGGENIGNAFGGLILCPLIGIGVVFWVMRDSEDGDDYGDHYERSNDREISKLQNELQSAIKHAEFSARDGRPADAAYWRSQAAVIESQLRSHGA